MISQKGEHKTCCFTHISFTMYVVTSLANALPVITSLTITPDQEMSVID